MAFYYAKATEGRSWLSPQFWGQWNAAKALGLRVGMFHFWRYADDPGEQARHFAGHAKASDYGDLPLVMDFEDVRAPMDASTFVRMATFYHVLRDALPDEVEVIVYSARWWWDPWVKPFVNKAVWNPYALRLWEADPPPETPNPGEWVGNVIQQTELDVLKPGYAHAIDVDWMAQSYWDELFPLARWENLTPLQRDQVLKELAIDHGLVAG